MSNLFVMSCPLQKVTEYDLQQDEKGNVKSLTVERFGTCYGAKCPFFDNICEGCMATKVLTTMQR